MDIAIEPQEFLPLSVRRAAQDNTVRIISGFTSPIQIYFTTGEVTTSLRGNANIWLKNSPMAEYDDFDNVAYGLRIRKSLRATSGQGQWAVSLICRALRSIAQSAMEACSSVATARAIVIDPELLLLDEPLSNLDAKLRISLRKQIREIQSTLGITAVYVTHDQEEALEISDRIAVMDKGDLQQVGTPEEVYERPANHLVASFVGEANFVEGRVTPEGWFERPEAKLRVQLDEKILQGSVSRGNQDDDSAETIRCGGRQLSCCGTITRGTISAASNDMSCAWQTTANLCGKPSTTDSVKGSGSSIHRSYVRFLGRKAMKEFKIASDVVEQFGNMIALRKTDKQRFPGIAELFVASVIQCQPMAEVEFLASEPAAWI